MVRSSSHSSTPTATPPPKAATSTSTSTSTSTTTKTSRTETKDKDKDKDKKRKRDHTTDSPAIPSSSSSTSSTSKSNSSTSTSDPAQEKKQKKAKQPPPPLPSTESPLPIATPPPTEGDHVIAAVAKTAAWEHVRTFTEERANWKFQKVRQSWLLHHAYDRIQLPKTYFKMFLTYISEMQGASRVAALEEAKKIVAKYQETKDSLVVEDSDVSAESAVELKKESKRKYQRAQQILEVLSK